MRDPILESAERIALGLRPGDPLPPGPVTVCLADVSPEPVDWLWPGRLPRGKLCTLDGDPGVAKSTLTVDWSARITTGSPWPDGASCPQGVVLVMSAEDGLSDTIRPRIDAAGGDPNLVHALTELRLIGEDGKSMTRPPTLADIDHIEAAIRQHNAVLLVVDVLMAYMPGKVDSHRDQDVRGVLHRLSAMAERTGCCVLLLRHLSKSHGGSAIYSGGGSIGIIGAARVGMVAGADPDDETGERRILAVAKSNLARKPNSLVYQLVPHDDVARIQWGGISAHTADRLVSYRADGEDRTERDGAADWLHEYLVESGGEAPAGEIKKAARAAGIAERTLDRARERIDATTGRRGFGKGAQYVWQLPSAAPSSPHGRHGRQDRNAGVQGVHVADMGADVIALHPDRTGCARHPDAPQTSDGRCPQCIVDKLRGGDGG